MERICFAGRRNIDYFSDLLYPVPSKPPESQENAHAGRSLRAIKKTFGNLQDLLHKLELLRDDLSRDFEIVSENFLLPAAASLREISR